MGVTRVPLPPGGAVAGAAVTHAGRHVPAGGLQQLERRAGAGEALPAAQAAQHVPGVGDAPGHAAEPGAGL